MISCESNWRMRASGRPSAALPDRCSAMLLEAVPHTCGQPSEDLLEMAFTSKKSPKWSPNGSQMAPQRPLGAAWPAEGLLERSEWALGELLERSWAVLGPQKVIGNGSWTARGHRGDWFQHCLEAKYPPKRSPGGSQIEVRKRSKLKLAKH